MEVSWVFRFGCSLVRCQGGIQQAFVDMGCKHTLVHGSPQDIVGSRVGED